MELPILFLVSGNREITGNSEPSSFYEGVALVDIGKKVRFINKQGNFITPAFDFASGFDRGVAIVMVGRTKNMA